MRASHSTVSTKHVKIQLIATSPAYEGIVSEFLARYPGLDPVWDEEWRSNADGYADVWIKWSEADDEPEANLEHGISKNSPNDTATNHPWPLSRRRWRDRVTSKRELKCSPRFSNDL
jgi:hypothetical protein